MAPPDPRIKKACIAMEAFGIKEAKVRPVLRQLRKTYCNNWDFIEDENYRVLLDAILEQDNDQATEKKKEGKTESNATAKKEGKTESNHVAMSREKKKALEQTQLASKDEEDGNDEDEVPLRRLRRKREGGCDNNIDSSTSKKPNIEDPKHTQLAVKDKSGDVVEGEHEKEPDNITCLRLGSTSSKKQNEEDGKPEEEDEDEVPLRKLSRKRERGCDNNISLTLGSSKPNIEDSKAKDAEMAELPLLKRYLRRTGEKVSSRTVDNNKSPSFSNSMSMELEELPPTMFLPADPVVAEKESVSSALIIVKNDPVTDHEPVILENCSTPILEMEKSNGETDITLNDTTAMVVRPSEIVSDMVNADDESCAADIYVDEQDGEIDVTLNNTTAMVVPPSEIVSDMVKAGDEICPADISMGLVVVPECEISADGWRAFSNKKDITVGEESVEIPWVNEVNDHVPARFRYTTHSYVFQDAAVKFSVSSIDDKQCCFLCDGDCLDSSMPCNCRIAYTVDGVLKDDFLEARISEARDQRKQVLQFCQECPVEKAKKEEIVEPCKGHIKRKAIQECWLKCGCSKRCSNRLVQRGIHNKLEVFFTSNGKGWGLRTLERLPQGSFVCDYVGEILTISELHQRELASPVILDAHWGSSEEGSDDRKSLCLDGRFYGNVSRFINHRCLDANLIEIPVHVETQDQHYYHLAFYTTRDIEPMEELTWDYGVDFKDEDCLMKLFDCACGSRFCRNYKQSKKGKKTMNRA